MPDTWLGLKERMHEGMNKSKKRYHLTWIMMDEQEFIMEVGRRAFQKESSITDFQDKGLDKLVCKRLR